MPDAVRYNNTSNLLTNETGLNWIKLSHTELSNILLNSKENNIVE